MGSNKLDKKKTQAIHAITEKFVLDSARSDSKVVTKLNVAGIKRDSKDLLLTPTGSNGGDNLSITSSRGKVALGSIGEPLSYQEYMGMLQQQAHYSKKTQDVSVLREIAKKLYEYCPRVMRWNHRTKISLRHPKVVDLIKINMTLVNEEAIQEQLDKENEIWGDMDKKWDTIQDIYELVAYSKDLAAKRNVLLMSKELSTVINKLWKHVSVDSNYLDKKTYFYMHELLYDLLLTTPSNENVGDDVATQTKHMYSALERFEAIEHDWKIDRKLSKKPMVNQYGGPVNFTGKGIQFEVFYISIFEFIDNWTLSTNLEDYVSFIQKIYTQLSSKRINLHVSKLKKKISKLQLASINKNIKSPQKSPQNGKPSPLTYSSRSARFKLPEHADTQSDTISMDDFLHSKPPTDQEILQRLLKKKKEDFEQVSSSRTTNPRKGSISLGQKPMIFGLDSPGQLKLQPIDETLQQTHPIKPEPGFENLMKQMVLEDEEHDQKQEMLSKLKSIAESAVEAQIPKDAAEFDNALISLPEKKKDTVISEKKQMRLRHFFVDKRKEEEERRIMKKLKAAEKKANAYHPTIDNTIKKSHRKPSVELKNQSSSVYHEKVQSQKWKTFNQPKDMFPEIDAIQETKTGLPVSVKLMLSRSKQTQYEKSKFDVHESMPNFSHQRKSMHQKVEETHFSIVGVNGAKTQPLTKKTQQQKVNTLKLLPSVERKEKQPEEDQLTKKQHYLSDADTTHRFENIKFREGTSYAPTLSVPIELHRRDSDVKKRDHQALMNKLSNSKKHFNQSKTHFLLSQEKNRNNHQRNGFSNTNSLASLTDHLVPLYNPHQPVTRLLPESVNQHHVNSPYRTTTFETKSILTNTYPRPPLRKLTRELDTQSSVHKAQKYRHNYAVTRFGNHAVVIRNDGEKSSNTQPNVWI